MELLHIAGINRRGFHAKNVRWRIKKYIRSKSPGWAGVLRAGFEKKG